MPRQGPTSQIKVSPGRHLCRCQDALEWEASAPVLSERRVGPHLAHQSSRSCCRFIF